MLKSIILRYSRVAMLFRNIFQLLTNFLSTSFSENCWFWFERFTPTTPGTLVFMDYRSGCTGLHSSSFPHMMKPISAFLFGSGFLQAAFFGRNKAKQNKKGISIIYLETWNSAVKFVSLLVGGIPCSKPEHFLSVVEQWNNQCCTVL